MTVGEFINILNNYDKNHQLLVEAFDPYFARNELFYITNVEEIPDPAGLKETDKVLVINRTKE